MYSMLALFLAIGIAVAHPEFLRRQGFDPASQRIDVSGAHAFQPPGPSDLRGPCPGLNALANHGYIARNGYTNLVELSSAIENIYGAGVDLATFIVTLGVVEAGDGTHLSIGGPPGITLPVVGGLLGQPRGLSNSHNRFEADGSPVKGDLYQFGEAVLTRLPYFQALYDLPGPGTVNPNYDLGILGQNAVLRSQQSESQNPYYFRGPVGFGIPVATHSFLYRFISNKSAAYPEGFLDRDTLKSFYAISGDAGSFTYTPGNERIPENWYKRAVSDPYTFPKFFADLGALIAQHPELSAFGGNTGTVNSFAGLNITDLTGGVYNTETLLQGNNFACFVFQAAAFESPDLIRNAGVISDIAGAVAKVNSALAQAITGLGCPQLHQYDFDDSQFDKYPGWSKLNKDGTYS